VNSFCHGCVRSLLPGLAVCSALDFSGVPARVLRAFKEDGRTGLARPLGGALAAAVARVEGAGAEVAIVPVPSSRRAFRRRGYETSACWRAGAVWSRCGR
jgi:predicted amidophosphoribosyltransferase